ncbi:hypothetical protein FT663_03221 [Candidozyma haemuli var. vulneris]|uniref:Uncharacterized protein n=1 Tax=Candidozyma haemuli TaxID=45357 RepID=A0A2V1AW40_9ASCO|nr:hypothetical protein CXQ85_004678 [[Candida] haemuloni]KAF3988714.1 hypothetical protein FT662_03242 [[Candida] haemuloni var. vulneris]KAF3990368.1 hypothetical protein FT663_03221 [[Candida] haemuloni var. vulneris]PVH22012.1 hypothetical protein CXQ85_004678 [[Candida] haemuloni]
MVRLVVPPVEARLHNTLTAPLETGVLNDDVTWENTVLPSLLDRVRSVKAAVHQAQTTNASGPSAKDVDTISSSCDKIEKHLKTQFANGAPFTIYRLAELVLEPEKSGYSLATVQSAERYLAAFARTVLVSSKETEHLAKEEENGVGHLNGSNGSLPEPSDEPNRATPAQYEEYDLPRDVTFLSLPWAHPSKNTNDDDHEEEETSPSKKHKSSGQSQLLSPLRESSSKDKNRSKSPPDQSEPTSESSNIL